LSKQDFGDRCVVASRALYALNAFCNVYRWAEEIRSETREVAASVRVACSIQAHDGEMVTRQNDVGCVDAWRGGARGVIACVSAGERDAKARRRSQRLPVGRARSLEPKAASHPQVNLQHAIVIEFDKEVFPV